MSENTSKFQVASPISWIIFHNLKNLYLSELERGIKSNATRSKFHYFSLHGISAFPMATAVWEAILNEQFTSEMLFSDVYKENLLYDILDESDKWDIKTKTLMFPKFLFNRTFDNSSNLFSNFTSLVQIRNNVVHYRYGLNEGPDKAVRNLRSQKITYPKSPEIGVTWHTEISSTECIRFCINVVSELVNQLSNLETTIYKEHCRPIFVQQYSPITDEMVRAEFDKFMINPDTDEGSIFK